MIGFKNILSPILFVILILCFSLPFFNITCKNDKMQTRITTITGFELMQGTTINHPQMYNETPKEEDVSAEPLAIIAFAIAVLALILSFFRKAVLPVAVLSFVGAITLLLLSSKINSDITAKVELLGITTEWAIGMYTVLILFIGGTILNIYLLYENSYRTVDLDEYTQRMKICVSCGIANDRRNVYCSRCGQMLA